MLLAAAPLATAQSIEDKAQACAACHGEGGVPPDKSWPVIWGQHQGYLYLQLRDFKSGARKNDVMGPIAQPLERDDMLALALYFSRKAWPNLRQPRAPAPRTRSRRRLRAPIDRSAAPDAIRPGTRAKEPNRASPDRTRITS